MSAEGGAPQGVNTAIASGAAFGGHGDEGASFCVFNLAEGLSKAGLSDSQVMPVFNPVQADLHTGVFEKLSSIAGAGTEWGAFSAGVASDSGGHNFQGHGGDPSQGGGVPGGEAMEVEPTSDQGQGAAPMDWESTGGGGDTSSGGGGSDHAFSSLPSHDTPVEYQGDLPMQNMGSLSPSAGRGEVSKDIGIGIE